MGEIIEMNFGQPPEDESSKLLETDGEARAGVVESILGADVVEVGEYGIDPREMVAHITALLDTMDPTARVRLTQEYASHLTEATMSDVVQIIQTSKRADWQVRPTYYAALMERLRSLYKEHRTDTETD